MFKPISQLKPKFFLKTGHQAYNGTLKSSCLSEPQRAKKQVKTVRCLSAPCQTCSRRQFTTTACP